MWRSFGISFREESSGWCDAIYTDFNTKVFKDILAAP
jgi:hypothetical protein